MGPSTRHNSVYVSIAVFVIMIALGVDAKTPPGIANNPSNARCMDDRYKTCKNLVHVCPKFCPDSCYVDCVSCKPQCGPAPPTIVPSQPPPTPTVTPSPPPPTPTVTPSPTPPTPTVTPSPPPPTPTVTPSPPPPTPTVTPSPPPPTPTVTPSPPPPTPTVTPSPPPPTPTVTPSPPPPTPTVTPSPPPPTPTVTPSPPPPTPTVTPSPPPPLVPTGTYYSPPPPTPTVTPASPPPPQQTPPTPTPSIPSPSPPPSPTTPSDNGPPPPPQQTPPTPSTPTTTYYPPPPPSDSSEGAGVRRARCKNKNYPKCYNLDHTCPSTCPYGCSVDCVTCKAVCQCDGPGAVCQDPRFVGGDGIMFYFHGKKDQDFCLVADSNLHINAHFIGKRGKYMKRDFTWVESIGILFGKHKLFIGAKKTATWDNSVDRLALSFDGIPIDLAENDGAMWVSESKPTASVTRVGGNTNIVAIKVEGKFKITARVVPITKQESKVHNYGITEDDCFAHLDLSFKFHSLTNQVDGILGQTYRSGYVSRVKIGANMPLMGGDDKFVTSSLFKPDCNVAQFSGANEDGSETNVESMLELPSLSCSSRFDGRGVVCKR